MKKLILPLLFAAAISFVGCKKAEEAPATPAMQPAPASTTMTTSTETVTTPATQTPAAETPASK